MKISGLVLGGALLLSCACSVRSCLAQDKAPEAPVEVARKTYSLRLRNVKPSWVAFWLDPQHQARPKEFGPESDSELKNRTQGGIKGVFSLLTGVERIVAIDPQNAILVFGTAEGVTKLRETIAFLDRPLRQVEVEVQFVEVTPSDALAFGIDFSAKDDNFNPNAAAAQPKADEGIRLGVVRGHFEEALRALQNASRAKVLSAPRTTIINNNSGVVEANRMQEFFIYLWGGRAARTPAEAEQHRVTMKRRTTFKMFITPTLNNDGTVTMVLNPTGTTRFAAKDSSSIGTEQSLFSATAVANAKDGETVVLGGFDSNFVRTFLQEDEPAQPEPIPNDLPLSNKTIRGKNRLNEDLQLLVFITPRIVRRIENAPEG